MKYKLLAIWILTICFLVIMVGSVTAIPVSGVTYWPLNNNDTDIWASNDLTTNLGDFVTSFPTYNTTGNGSTHSLNLVKANSDYAEVTHSSNLDFSTSNFSVSIWTKQIDSSGGGSVIGKGSQAEAEWRIYTKASGNGIDIVMRDGSTTLTGSGSYDIAGDGWTHLVLVIDRTAGTTKLYKNNTLYINLDISSLNDIDINDYPVIMGDNYQGIGLRKNTYYNGYNDEVKIFNKTLNTTEITNLFNLNSITTGTPPVPPGVPTVTFKSQTPSDISDTNLFSNYLNITYGYSPSGNTTDVLLNFTTISPERSCVTFENGSCSFFNASYRAVTFTTADGLDNYSWTLDADNQVYPGTSLFDEEVFEDNAHSTTDSILTTTATYLKVNLKNVSNTTDDGFLELMANVTNGGTASLQTYYCNETYTTGSVVSSSNCALFGNLAYDQAYNHTHSVNSKHHLIPFSLSAGTISGVKVSSNSYFVFRSGNSVTDWSIYHIPNVTTTSTFTKSTNNGVVYSNLAYTPDMHLHQFSGNDYISYQATGIINGTFNESAFRNDTFQIDALPPTTPNLITPLTDANINSFLYISYLNSTFHTGSTSQYYNISLLNSDLTFNRTIIANNSLSLSYNYSIFAQNLTLGTYFVEVTAYDDTYGLTTMARNSFNLVSNALMNLTLVEAITGGSITGFNGWLYDYNTTTNTTFTTATTIAHVPIIRGNFYLVSAEKTGSLVSTKLNFTANQTSYTNVTMSAFTWNSIYVRFHDADNLSIIDFETINIEVISTVFVNNVSTSNGTIYLTLLTPSEYELRMTSTSYVPTSKFITVTNNSVNIVNIYLQKNATTQLQRVHVVDTANQPVEGAVIRLQKEFLNSTDFFRTVQEVTTDYNGFSAVSVVRSTTDYYRFIVIVNGTVKLTTTKTFFIPGLTETIELVIDLEDSDFDEITNLLGISTRLERTGTHNQTFNFTFIDARSTIVGGRLYITGQFLNSSLEQQNISDQSVLDFDGEITYTLPVLNNTRYTVYAYIIFEDGQSLVYEVPVLFGESDLVDRNTGMLYAVIILLFVAFVTISLGALYSGVFSLLVLVVLSAFGLISVPITIITSFIAFFIIVFIKIKGSGGTK